MKIGEPIRRRKVVPLFEPRREERKPERPTHAPAPLKIPQRTAPGKKPEKVS